MKSIFQIVLVLVLCGLTQAYVITFEDITDDTYYVGDSFVSGGVQITGEEFFWTGGGSTVSGSATVQASGDAGGTGNEIWFNNINLSFDFSVSPLYGLSLQFGDYGGNENIEINGDQRVVDDIASLNGMTIGGVTLTVVDTGTTGALFAVGSITSFSIGGQEFSIDNVIACIPEPASLILLGLGALVLKSRKR